MGAIELTPTATESQDDLPAEIVLLQNYPNPFNPTTTISFTLHRPSEVTLAVYSALGQRLTTLADTQRYGQGTHRVRFEAGQLPSGVYFYRLEAEGFSTTKTMLLIK